MSSLCIHADAEDEDIYELLQERQVLFNEYADQIKKRTGIFGQQTKRDVRKARDILLVIVEKDNEIIAELERMLENRQMEYFDAGIDKQRAEEKNDRIIGIIDGLKEQKDKLLEENEKLRRMHGWSRMIAIIAGLMSAMFLIFYMKSKLFK